MSNTINYNLDKPTPLSDLDTWGAKLNAVLDGIDSILKNTGDTINNLNGSLSGLNSEISSLDTVLDGLESRSSAVNTDINTLETQGEYTCSLASYTWAVAIDGLEQTRDQLQYDLDEIGLGGGMTGNFVFIDGLSDRYQYTFEDGLLKSFSLV